MGRALVEAVSLLKVRGGIPKELWSLLEQNPTAWALQTRDQTPAHILLYQECITRGVRGGVRGAVRDLLPGVTLFCWSSQFPKCPGRHFTTHTALREGDSRIQVQIPTQSRPGWVTTADGHNPSVFFSLTAEGDRV